MGRLEMGTTRSAKTLLVTILGVLCAACGQDSSPTGPSGSTGPGLTLHVEISDPSGDALNNQPNPPDLVQAGVDVRSGSVTLEIVLAAGTFDPQATRLYVAFDTDQSAATGNAAWGIGTDYDAWVYAIDRSAEIRRRFPNSAPPVTVGTVSATLGANGMNLIVPLSLLGGDDGRLDFQIHSSGDPRVAGQSAAILDFMPNLGLPPGRVQ
jgi:hypothetical protein